jgi:hypothetical protein
MNNINKNRYLLKVKLSTGQTFDKTFKTETLMNEYIMARDFFFINADYTIYDLAIELKTAI